MFRVKRVISCLLVILLFASVSGCGDKGTDDRYGEGISEKVKTTTWFDSENNKHTADFYTNGKTATDVVNELSGIVLNHIYIDDIPIYEVYSETKNSKKMIFFFHGQGSRKEEYLPEIQNYVDAGYYCVTVDLCGHGERMSDEAVMSICLTTQTAKDIDTLIEYYNTIPNADTGNFALLGLSQGGSVAYWYAAYGKHKPSALIVGSTTPDFQYQDDKDAIKNGELVDSIWTTSEFESYVNQSNPINKLENFVDIPTLSGNGIDDHLVSYKGAENLEKAKFEAEIDNSQFFYFANVGHEVTEDFMMRIIPFLNGVM